MEISCISLEITIKVKMSRFSISDKEFISFFLYANNFHFYSLQFMFHEFITFDIYGVRTLISKIRNKNGHVYPVNRNFAISQNLSNVIIL